MTAVDTARSLLGVALGEPCGKVRLHPDGWTSVGVLIATDARIEAVPCFAVTEFERSVLLAFADQVAVHGRDTVEGWQYDDRIGWIVGIRVRTELEAW